MINDPSDPIEAVNAELGGGVSGKVNYIPDAQRLLPQSEAAEKGVLSSILLSPNASLSICVMRGITPDAFFIPGNRRIFEVLLILWAELPDSARITNITVNDQALRETANEATPKIDFITLTQKLRDLGELESTGGAAYVTELFTFLPTAANVVYYIDILKEKTAARRGIVAYTEGTARLYDGEFKTADIVANVNAQIISVVQRREIEPCTSSALDKVERMLIERETGYDGAPLGTPTGVPGWINQLRGLFDETMYVIASLPGVGKTALMEQMMTTQAQCEMHSLCIQKDMSVTNMLGRMAARDANVSYEKFVCGELSKESLAYFREALFELRGLAKYLHIYDTHGMTANMLDMLVRSHKERHGIKAFYLDHFLQLRHDSNGGHGGNYVENLTQDSSTIRTCINETLVPGVILVHINREGSKKERPSANDIKYCSALLADSDVTGVLFSTDDPRELEPNVLQQVTLSIEKNRNGAPGDEIMYFHRERTRYVEPR